ncbi:interferon-induced protein with tetratricopeptide repeats 2-like [Scomber japonicus]|uniref:interferon-induced protein with tetratricopeptide repeats 2-like n=1 Tax=Scomber japonicus TaxID=13676 RepID=UPI00230523C0|nr:interferon-induced protein with tetratricopeptide repeats 2-like [Scomber japonicus]
MWDDSAQSQSTLEAKLKALQCHFTWNIEHNSKFYRIKDKLKDIGTDEGNSWLGHIYNLQGYIHYQLKLKKDALCFLKKATEAFRQSKVSDEGPWLVVNYGNLTWLHHKLGEEAESQTYLSKVDTLLKEYSSPSQDELHPEIYAEKAWTLMKINQDKNELAADYFQRAIRMQPDMVEWHTSYVIGLVKAHKYGETPLEEEILEKMRMAKERDPENLYLAALELEQRALREERIEDEARELARLILRNPVSSYSGIKVLLWVYSEHISVDEAIALAEEALEKYPDVRYLKWCAALCYKWKILPDRHSHESTIHRAVNLHKEVISLYPNPSSSLVKKIALANLYAKSRDGLAKAEQTYQELLATKLELAERQMLYSYYAKYLYFNRKDNRKSIEYYMKVAKIPLDNYFQRKSIEALENFKDRNPGSPMVREIEKFLDKLRLQKS